jgi:TPR repeat protein
LALTLWHGGGSFRSFLEFALIGAIVLGFLHGLNVDFSGLLRQFAPRSHDLTANIPGSAGPKLPITPHMDEVMFDEGYFTSAAEPLRTHLMDASRAYAAHDYQRMLDDVASDDPTDRRVLLVRGAAMVKSSDQATFVKGLELLISAGKLGEPKAIAILGILRLVGFVGYPKDVPRGRALLERAVTLGDVSAARVLGTGYISGWLGSIDPARAVQLLRSASDRGDPEAMFQLARILETGLGVSKNPSEAEQLMRKAAEAGYVDAQMMLGLWQLRAYSAGLAASPDSALEWLRRASERGQDDATFALGVFYMISKPTLGYSDPKRGAELLRLCAQRSLSAACTFAYATVLEEGSGVAVDRVRAYAFYELSDTAESTPRSRERLKNMMALMSRQEIAAADTLVAQLRTAVTAPRKDAM